MKATELMIDDWVQTNHDGKIIKYQVHMLSDDNIIGDYLVCREVDPIPLTVEILDKNGLFDSDEVNYDNPYDGDFLPRYFSKDEESYGDVEIVKENNKIYASINCAEYFIMELRYVHELQHLLRLHGINKEIII